MQGDGKQDAAHSGIKARDGESEKKWNKKRTREGENQQNSGYQKEIRCDGKHRDRMKVWEKAKQRAVTCESGKYISNIAQTRKIKTKVVERNLEQKRRKRGGKEKRYIRRMASKHA